MFLGVRGMLDVSWTLIVDFLRHWFWRRGHQEVSSAVAFPAFVFAEPRTFPVSYHTVAVTPVADAFVGVVRICHGEAT
jgi:hypothetical protein